MGRTVNPLASPSGVRIPPGPPYKMSAQVVELVDARRHGAKATMSEPYPRAKREGYTTSLVNSIMLAQVVELVDTTVLEAVALRCKSSSLFLGTNLGELKIKNYD